METIRIGPIDFKYVESELIVSNDAKQLDGKITYNKQQIEVASPYPEQYRRLVLWHEIVHGILNLAGRDCDDEGLIDALAGGIVQVLRDNPQLREFIEQVKA